MEKRISRTLAFITIAALLDGCATFRPRPLAPTQTAAEFKARTLDTAGLKEFLRTNLGHELASWPPKIWDFQMLRLAAFYYHPDLDVVRAKWGIAEAIVITAGEHPNPNVSFLPEYNFSATGGISPWIVTPTLDIPIETAGKRGYRIDQAKHLFEAARLNISTVAWQVRSRLRARLVELYASRQTETFLLKQETVQQEVVKLLEQRLELGEASQPDLTQERIALARTQLSLRDAQKQSAEARVRLADALGLSVAALDGIDLSFGFFARTSVDLPSERVQRRALLNRPDILSALSDYAARQSALQLETARQYPDIHLGPGYSWDQGDNKWSLGVSLTLPVFNQNQGPIAEAEARRHEAAARFIALQAQVMGAIDRALAGYRAARQALETADRLVDARKNQQHSVQAQFDVGQVDRLVLRSADLEVAAAELSRFNTLTIVQRTIGSLEDAVHQPLNPTQAVTNIIEKDPRPSEGKDQ